MKHLKNAIAMLLCVALCAGMTVCVSATEEADVFGDVLQDNFMRITSTDAWNKGTMENVEVTTEVGNGAIRLVEGQLEGTWTSEEIDVPAFEYMVASWSADTPEGASVEIKVRAYVDLHDQWSGWMSWGKWGNAIKRGSANTKDDRAYVDTDILTIRGSDGESASKIQVQAVLRAKEGFDSPVLRDISTTSKNTLEGQAIPVYYPHPDMELPEKVLLDTPAYSQMRRDSAIGSVICSPTSMTMMLNDRDSSLDLFPEEVALRNFDFIYEGFGNWPYTTAIAGSFGYSAACHYGDLDFVRQELAAGRSVALSVRYASSPSGSNPYLENGAANDTSGHLIVIVGYETIDGVDYFISNDAATSPDSACALRKYRADQLDICWNSRILYQVSSEPEVGAGQYAPQRIEGELEMVAPDAYVLKVNGEVVELNKAFARKTSTLGAGTAFVITDNANIDTLPEPLETTTANKVIRYVNVNGNGQLYISTANMQQMGAKSATAYIIINNGPTYVASVTFPEPESPAEPETPAAPETPAEPEAPAETPVEPETPAVEETPVEKGVINPAIVVVGIVIVVAAVLVIVKSKKK